MKMQYIGKDMTYLEYKDPSVSQKAIYTIVINPGETVDIEARKVPKDRTRCFMITQVDHKPVVGGNRVYNSHANFVRQFKPVSE